VDPDDVTRQGLIDAGCTDCFYGAPILPGATLLGRIGDVKVIGVPACGLYHTITSFDLLLPRLLAGLTINRKDLARMGHGAFCRKCSTCNYPKCEFGG
jgi:formylmethanofuran dehydrogenase subunit E